MASERTPLVPNGVTPPSDASGSAPTVYFLGERRNSESSHWSHHRRANSASSHGSYNVSASAAAAEAEEIETIPEGSIFEDFEPRRVSVAGDASVASRTRSRSTRPAATTAARAKHGGWLSFFSNVGKKSHAFAITGEEYVVRGGLSRLPRSAPVKIDPKVFFANERTFLAWMHVSVILAGASVAIVAFSDAAPSRHRSHATVADQLYGVILLPVSIAFILYAMMQYSRRASMIRRKAPGPYVDVAGPTVLTVILMLSIVAQFSVKLYTLM